MSRRTAEMIRVHDAADVLEREMAARVERALIAARESVQIYELALALASGEVEQAMRLLPKKELQERFSPVVTTSIKGFKKGGQLAVEEARRLS